MVKSLGYKCVYGEVNVLLPPEHEPLYEMSANEVEEFGDLIENDSLEFRRQFREFVANEKTNILKRDPDEDNLDMHELRAITLKRMQTVMSAGLVSVNDILNDPLRFIASHELLSVLSDPSSVYMYSVHMNLFGGSVLKLGTKQHHDNFLEAIDAFDFVGCFALTEAVHGVNSGFNMDTFATFDKDTDEFIIHTPTLEAQKTWISLAANNARYAVIFAKLLMNDNDEGVHAFLVRIRHDDGKLCDSVRITDQGHKPALNGNDNGRLMFDHLRVPRSALLDRYSQVDRNGTYTSSIPKKRDRFLKVADQLMSGRMCIASAGVCLAKRALSDAIRYSIMRKAHRWNGTTIAIYDNLSHRKQLTLLLSRIMALQFGVNYTKERYAFQSEKDRNEVVDLVCGMKSYACQEGIHISGIARDKCGGVGLVSASRMCELNIVAASLSVVEGDAAILAQKCTKGVLGNFNSSRGMLGLIKTMIVGNVQTQIYKTRIWLNSLKYGVEHNEEFYALLFRAREHLLVMELASKLYSSVSKHRIFILDAWAKCHNELVMQVHHAHIINILYTKFREAMNNAKSQRVHRVLRTVCMLFATQEVEQHLGWFLCNTPISRSNGTNISNHVTYLTTRITKTAMLSILDGLRLPANSLLSCEENFQDSLKF